MSGGKNVMDERRKAIEEQLKLVRERMSRVKHKIAVISGKGGVGKSLVTANLAVALAKEGYRVGVLDADIHGPSIPKMLGVHGERMLAGPVGILPVKGPLGVEVASVDFLLPDESTPIIWRGPLKMHAIRQFLSDVAWGELDFLLIDLPPGTGDEPLSIAQLIQDMDGFILVTAPSELSELVVKKAGSFARKIGIPIIGVVENMSWFKCPNCGAELYIFGKGAGERVARELGVKLLGKIPIDPRISEATDEGIPFILKHPDSEAAREFMKIVRGIEEYIKNRESGDAGSKA